MPMPKSTNVPHALAPQVINPTQVIFFPQNKF